MVCEAKNKKWTLCGSLFPTNASLEKWPCSLVRRKVASSDSFRVIVAQWSDANQSWSSICFHHLLRIVFYLEVLYRSAPNALCNFQDSNRRSLVIHLRYQLPASDSQCLASQGLSGESKSSYVFVVACCFRQTSFWLNACCGTKRSGRQESFLIQFRPNAISSIVWRLKSVGMIRREWLDGNDQKQSSRSVLLKWLPIRQWIAYRASIQFRTFSRVCRNLQIQPKPFEESN